MKMRLGCEGPYNASNKWDRKMSCLTYAHKISAANFYIVGLVEDTVIETSHFIIRTVNV